MEGECLMAVLAGFFIFYNYSCIISEVNPVTDIVHITRTDSVDVLSNNATTEVISSSRQPYLIPVIVSLVLLLVAIGIVVSIRLNLNIYMT